MIYLISPILVAIFLFLIYFFAGIETGVVSLDQNVLLHRASLPDRKGEKSLLKFSKQPERFLALTLIGLSMSLVIATSITTDLLEKIGPIAVTIGSAIESLLIFFVCELLPKMAFAAKPIEMSLKFIRLLEFFDKILYVPIRVLNYITHALLSKFHLEGDFKKKALSREELLILLSFGASSGTIRERHHRMARGIIGLKETRVCEIMIPRVKVIALEASASINTARSLVKECGFSRVPVFEGNIDQIVGVIYFKDLFLEMEKLVSLKQITKKPLFVPESKNALELFKEMRIKNTQTAVVLDEYGATGGFVTLEDLLEEVVGEIRDELDESTTSWKRNLDGSIIIKADINLANLARDTGIDFTAEEHVSTLNGLILQRLGRIPTKGECLLIDTKKMEVLASDQRKVQIVKVLEEKSIY
ncbi:MAG: HlyC/CorC family transporter [Candidatus Riflebacteria bacterium]|nr:HlyC/CorC family transporter [Candidatus Riflebacteria bacterium]